MFGRLVSPIFVLGMLAVPVMARAQDTTPAQASNPAATSSSSNPATTPSKKVWTNDDLPEAKSGSPVAADKRNQIYRITSNQPADAATVLRIKKNLEKLQAQLDDVNKKLKIYKAFQDGEAVSSSGREINRGYNRVPVDQQVAQLLDKKKQLEGQIGDLNDEARKKGIDPGQLR